MFVTLNKEHAPLKNSNYFTIAFAEANIDGCEKEIVVKRAMSEEGYPMFKQERDILYDVSNPGIVKIFGSDIKKKELYLEKIEGKNLFQYCNTNSIGMFESLFLMQEMSSTLSYLHSFTPTKKTIIHDDITYGNIMVTNDKHIKYIDFGGSFYKNRLPEYKRNLITGTPVFVAPEKEYGDYFASEKSDVYSLGIVWYVMLDKCFPYKFPNLNKMSSSDSFDAAFYVMKKKKPRTVSVHNKHVKELIMCMIEKDPHNRPTSNQVYTTINSII